ncbi:uncharacterized protein LOC126975631 isoform X2 [Leptidea sinapis]|uniref:uncharacterized protein LOC126975631 isoform X2 n=1 Tax=Leptidea sinapis TaxID=189913 RepID=UPI0021C41EEE|nr:uncharacterized protein LOC126975631 isoform X2 [Leptidea sinapis]
MFGRPRCREWTPLTTQQLRLRSLIQIVGYNIRPPEWCRYQCSFYMTLHHTTMSAPFYTSERITSPHPKWKEIDAELMQSMSSTNVVIRIWCHILSPKEEERNSQSQDTVIQTWGVYFSGLRYIGANLSLHFNSDCFKSNTLVFQMQGGYFCSYKSLKLDIIPPGNELQHTPLTGGTPVSVNKDKIGRKVKESPSPKTGREYSKSHSPVDRTLRQHVATLRPSSSLFIKSEGTSEKTNYIFEHSPIEVKESSTSDESEDVNVVDLSETAEYYDLRNESSQLPKYRYLALNFLKSEIRSSYTASKLQSLHLLQYAIKRRQDAVLEVREKIYQRSALADTLTPPADGEGVLKARTRSQKNLFSRVEECAVKSRSKSSSQSDREGDNELLANGKVRQPRLTLKLNDLLSYKTKPSPFQRAEHVRLTKQLEIYHFKRLILSDERDSKLANIRRMKETHAKLFEENQDVGLELMQDYHALSKLRDTLRGTRDSCNALRSVAAASHAALAHSRCELLRQLHDLFDIQQKDATTWSICGVPLPICDDEARVTNPLPQSVGAALAAQLTALAAAVLDLPLRYRVALTATPTVEDMVDLPNPKIPLYVRSSDATLFKYGMFLLNKCVAQLLWGRGLSVYDIRPTLANLRRLLTTPTNLSDTSKLFGTYQWLANGQCARAQSLRSLVASDRDRAKHCRQFNRFKDCLEGQSGQKVQRHKHSRSMGSCQDERELPLDAASSIAGSEPNIYNVDLETGDRVTHPDVELSHQQLFTETEKLLKMSSNNEDHEVQGICTAIEQFCADRDVCATREIGDEQDCEQIEVIATSVED